MSFFSKVKRLLEKDRLNSNELSFLLSFINSRSRFNKIKKFVDNKKSTDKFKVFLFYLAVHHNDMFVINKLYSFAVNSELVKAKIALGSLFLKSSNHYVSTQYFDEAFSSDPAKFSYTDVYDYVNALYHIGFLNKKGEVLQYYLEKYPIDARYKFLGLVHQAHLFLLDRCDKDTIYNNIRYLLNIVINNSSYFILGYVLYILGDYRSSFNFYDKFYQLLSPEDIKVGAQINNTICVQSLESATNILCNHIEAVSSYKPFLIGGTLLGFEREGRLLEHDKDADLGLFINEYQKVEQLVLEICKKPEYISPWMVSKPKSSLEWNVPIIDLKRRVTIDLFFFKDYHKDNTKYVCKINTSCGAIEWLWDKFSLAHKRYDKFYFWVPESPDYFLTTIFGDWHKEVKVWDSLLIARNLSSDSQIAAIHFGLQRLSKAFDSGDLNKIEMYLDALQKWKFQFSDAAEGNIRRLIKYIETYSEENKIED